MEILKDYPVVYEQSVAWGDMDAFGHVNNVIYYRYIESARIRYFDQLDVFNEAVLTVVASNQCKYLKPVFYPDTVYVGARVEEIRNSAIRMHYSLYSTAQQAVVATGEAVVVFVEQETMHKTLIPTAVREKMISLEQQVNHNLL